MTLGYTHIGYVNTGIVGVASSDTGLEGSGVGSVQISTGIVNSALNGEDVARWSSVALAVILLVQAAESSRNRLLDRSLGGSLWELGRPDMAELDGSSALALLVARTPDVSCILVSDTSTYIGIYITYRH